MPECVLLRVFVCERERERDKRLVLTVRCIHTRGILHVLHQDHRKPSIGYKMLQWYE